MRWLCLLEDEQAQSPAAAGNLWIGAHTNYREASWLLPLCLIPAGLRPIDEAGGQTGRDLGAWRKRSIRLTV